MLLFRTLTRVFATSREYRWQLYVVGYGVPILVMLATFVTSIARRDDYFREDACWLDMRYIWAFKGPVTVIVAFNFLVTIVALVAANRVS